MQSEFKSDRPRVSVIIPVYNAERWLRRCLDAVRRQTLRDIEIICVDDGSTDNSVTVLREYAAQDSRFRLVMLPKNMGASAARNRGIAVAQGEYLGFVDSDDHPALDFYEKLYARAVETNADIVKGNYRYWGLDGRSLPVDYTLNERVLAYTTNFTFAFCSAIYRRQLVADHAINFPEEQIDLEDPLFTLKIALVCDAIAIVDDAEINIRMHENSATFGPPSIKRIFAKFSGLSKMLDIINKGEALEERSYAFIVAFWFKSVVETSLQNQTIQAFRVVVGALYDVFQKVKYHEMCQVAFAQLGIGDLFSALASRRMTRLAAYVALSYDGKIFMADELRFRALKKKYAQARGVCIAIPLYTAQPGVAEADSLRQCFKILGGKHQIVFFGPESLDTTFYEKIVSEFGMRWSFEAFPDAYFESPLTYSKLLLIQDFYHRFSHAKYMLVYQLDCWVFRDELSLWCEKGYDYIGAPWFEGYAEADKDSPIISPSGNGGFSLRKIGSFIDCLHTLAGKITDVDDPEADTIDETFAQQHEDIIVVNLFPKLLAGFTIAPVEDAMRFSLEMFPERLYALTGELPFGCHAYQRFSPEFWARYIDLPEHNQADTAHCHIHVGQSCR
jgi:glycosyltransferase involved in cell wall biosynthesis